MRVLFGGTSSSYEDPSLASIMGSVTYSYRIDILLRQHSVGDGSSMVAITMLSDSFHQYH